MLLESILIVLLTKESSSLRLPAPALIGRLEELQKRRLPATVGEYFYGFFLLVTQRVWAEPDKNPTSTIFYRPKPEPDFST